MAKLSEDAIRDLAGFKGEGASVVTLYLHVDGRCYVRPVDYLQQLDQMLRDARERHGSLPGARDALQRIEDFVKTSFERGASRGLAIFACANNDLFEVFEVSIGFKNQLVVNSSPNVLQLEKVVEDYEPIGVLLADKQRTRMFVFELGELVDRTEEFEPLPRHEDDKGDFDRDHVRDHVANASHKHLKHAAEAAFRLWQERPFSHLVVGAPDEISRELEGELHSYLKEKMRGRIAIGVNASLEEIRTAVLDIEEQLERERESQVVARLRDAAGARNGGVAGLDEVLAALSDKRVELLLVSEGYEAPGWRCDTCGRLAAKGRSCPSCAAEMRKYDDIVAEA
ncbi:MAG TPA: hypothetical protein VMY34_07805, partial [Acidimicrobiales bacterium]|nr:hypothetical protein [Acidimicrobiales bacterium]